jgi:hypothetical protein
MCALQNKEHFVCLTITVVRYVRYDSYTRISQRIGMHSVFPFCQVNVVRRIASVLSAQKLFRSSGSHAKSRRADAGRFQEITRK